MSQAAKIAQNDLRKLMSQHKKKLSETGRKVESPLAKYLSDGRLKCIVCDVIVSLWSSHIVAKEHRDNIARRKATTQNAQNIQTVDTFKPPLPPPPGPKRPALRQLPHPPPKKLKSILKNAPAVPNDFFNKNSNSIIVVTEEAKSDNDVDMVPVEAKSDPVQSTDRLPVVKDSVDPGESTSQSNVQAIQDSDLPQGFFDDPILDAKARNVEYRDPVEEEWEKFQKEMKEQEELSARILQDDSEESTVDRQIEEVDEQINNWSRVLTMEKKKEDLQSFLSVSQEIKNEAMSDEDPDDDVVEFVSWRTKKSFK